MLIILGYFLKSGLLIDVECAHPPPTPNPLPYLIAYQSSPGCLSCIRSLISVCPLDFVLIFKGLVIIVFWYAYLIMPYPDIALVVFEISLTGAILTYPMLPLPMLVKSPPLILKTLLYTPKVIPREHFMYRHWKLKVVILQEGPEPLPRCDHFGIYMLVDHLFKHRRTKRCNTAMEMRIRQRYVEM